MGDSFIPGPAGGGGETILLMQKAWEQAARSTVHMTFELAFRASNTTVVHSARVSILLPIHTILLALEHVFCEADCMAAAVCFAGLKGGALVSTLYAYSQHGDPYVSSLVKHLLNQVQPASLPFSPSLSPSYIIP